MRDLEQEILASSKVCNKCADVRYAQNLYAAMCNMQWQPTEMWPILKNELWTSSWRHAGGIIADIRNQLPGISGEDYMDWYCSGLPGRDYEQDDAVRDTTVGYVPEGIVTDEIRQDLAELGWQPIAYDLEED